MDREQQKREIATIEDRTITLKLSDADCERLFNLCGKRGITVTDLLQCFIEDLIGRTDINRSDESVYARKYFEKCLFDVSPEATLLNLLLNKNYDVYHDFLGVIDDIDGGYVDLEHYKKYPDFFNEADFAFLRGEIAGWEKHIADIKADFLKQNETSDWEKAVEKVEQWWKEKLKFKNEDAEKWRDEHVYGKLTVRCQHISKVKEKKIYT